MKAETSSLKTYSMSEVIDLLKRYKLPYCYNYVQQYVNNSIIVKVCKNEYKFPSNPTYAGTIEKVLNDIRQSKKKYRETKQPQPLVIEEPNDEDKIARCIDFLKSKGFLILKQV